MLEANPELSWRDVYGVLATTSQKVYPDDPSWITNAVGLHHSDKFGFGLVDAEAAVKASQSFALYGPEKQVRLDSGPLNEVVPEFGPLEDLLPFELSLNDADVLNATGDAFMAAEHVVVYLELEYVIMPLCENMCVGLVVITKLAISTFRHSVILPEATWKLY